MNIKHVKGGVWVNLAFTSYTCALLAGIYGRRRLHFSSEHSYNKYHFAVALSVLNGAGLFISSKYPPPWHSGVFFLASIALNVLPAFYEGYKDMNNKPLDGSTSGVRKAGFYSFLTGVAILAYKQRLRL